MKEIDYYVPKFIKDSLDISDIKGTKSKYKITSKEIRKTNFVHDIEKARPAKEVFKEPKDMLKVDDINLKK